MAKIRFILMFVLLLGAASCARYEIEGDDIPIDFGQYVLKSSKAGETFITSTGNLPHRSDVDESKRFAFGVFGFFHGEQTGPTAGSWTDGNTNHPNLMLNQMVYWDNSAGKYVYSPARYWPRNPNDRISFFAYYPYDATGTVVLPMELDKDSDGMGKFRFWVNSNSGNQVDFMMSDLCVDQSKAAGVLTGSGNVQFNFRHMLSQVQIADVNTVHENELVDIEVTSIRFKGLAIRGDLAPDYKEVSSVWTTTFDWDNYYTAGGNSSISVEKCYTDDVTPVLIPSKVQLMIPQNLSGKTIEVEYTLTRWTDNTRTEKQYEYAGNKISTNLAIPGHYEWERNKIYKYTINLSPKAINFSAQIEDWLPLSGDNSGGFIDLE